MSKKELQARIDELKRLRISDGHGLGIAYGDDTPLVDGEAVLKRIKELEAAL